MGRPGILDQRVEIQRVTGKTPDGAGGYTETVTTIATVRAAVVPGGGSEPERAGRIQSETAAKFTIRTPRAFELLPTDRILWRGVMFEVRPPVLPSLRSGYVDVTAERGVAL